MNLTSPDFENNAEIPAEFSCQGKDISPELNISDIPEHTVSLVLIMEDPDAPKGTFTHWVMWNIPAGTTVIPKNAGTNFAIQGVNSSGRKGYMGPCPPNGTHRYFFKLYALTKTLNLPATSNRDDLLKAMDGLIIEHEQYMGTYRKTGT